MRPVLTLRSFVLSNRGLTPPATLHSPLILATLTFAGFLLIFSCAATRAQNYPTKPIRAIVPFAPGGGADIAARVVGQKLTERWGQPVIVDNRGGATGNIGAGMVSRARPDGYTLMITSSSFVISPSVYDALPFDPIKDFAPVIMVAPTYYLLVTHPSVPANSVRELLQLAKGGSYKLIMATSGVGGPAYLTGEMLKMMANINFLTVPYKGSGPALTDVLGGQQASFMFCDLIAGIPHVSSKRLNLLAVATAKRISKLPDVPTIAESGVPGFAALSWTGMFVPAGTPKPIIGKLNAELKSILKLTDVQERLASDGSDFGDNTPDYVAAFVKSEIAKWGKVAKASGTRLK